MTRVMMTVVLLIAALSTRCGGSPTSPSNTVTFDVDFATRPPGWIAGSSDYPVPVEPGINLVADYRTLPAPLNETQFAAYLEGNNNSEDLFMFYKTRVTGLVANGLYSVTFSAQIATNAPRGCYGIGGAPGEDSYVKAGASPREPERLLLGDRYVMNIDKGNQSKGGADAVVIGDMANSIHCRDIAEGRAKQQWELKALSSTPGALRTRAAPDGSSWLMLGVDHASIGLRAFYITKFSATLQRTD